MSDFLSGWNTESGLDLDNICFGSRKRKTQQQFVAEPARGSKSPRKAPAKKAPRKAPAKGGGRPAKAPAPKRSAKAPSPAIRPAVAPPPPPPPPPPAVERPCGCSHCELFRARDAAAAAARRAAQPPKAAAPKAPRTMTEAIFGESDSESDSDSDGEREPSARCRPWPPKSPAAAAPVAAAPARRRLAAAPKKATREAAGSAEALARASASRGRAYRSERRSMARLGGLGGSEHEPFGGGVYAETRRLRLRFARSKIHAWGVFADEPVAAGTFVLEYRGEEVGAAVAEARAARYEAEGRIDYLFRVDDETIVDATCVGSLARFVNHSCAPNCVTQIVVHAKRKKIALYAKRDILPGEELCYDYKFELEDDKIPCHCGAPTCRGSLN